MPKCFLKKTGQPGLFLFFRSFQIQFYRKIVDFSGIRTQIVGIEGEHADHLTTTTAHGLNVMTSLSITKEPQADATNKSC